MAQRALVNIPDGFVPLNHVARAVEKSDCRTPVIFVAEDGDPFTSVCALSKVSDSAVWSFDLATVKSANNVMDYIEVGLHNGDWVYITNCDAADESFFRECARTIYHLLPEPLKYPRREHFRAFFCLQKTASLYGTASSPFPPLMQHSALLARKTDEAKGDCHPTLGDCDHQADAAVHNDDCHNVGDPATMKCNADGTGPISGMLFHRSAELSNYVDNTPLAVANDIFARALEDEDIHVIKQMVSEGHVQLSRIFKGGMTPLQYCCSRALTKSAVALLELEADPNDPRESDGRPPLFMSILDVQLAEALIDAGGDIFKKYQGYRLDAHPDTSPEVSALAAKRRLEM